MPVETPATGSTSRGASVVHAPMVLTTALGTELLFKSMSASEDLGHLFEFDIEALADSGAIKAEELLGKPASVALELGDNHKRYFHGLVCAMGTSAADNRRYGYRLVLRPWLWLLTRRTDTRCFQSMTLEGILKEVFSPFKPEYRFELQGSLPKYEYCVQYRETDFNFVSRLMEQEGVYYYFTHTADKHTMVIVNSASAHPPNPWSETFEFRDSADGQLEFEPITQWRTQKEIQTGQVVLRDYDFVKPKTSLETSASASRDGASPLLEQYDYPGDYVEGAGGKRYSQLRIEELQARYSRVHGSGALRAMLYGTRFKLHRHPREDQNREHLVLSTRMHMNYSGYESGGQDTSCQCQFSAIDGDELFRPERATPKPVVAGVHTAVVVGPGGDEIYTDAHGRVKVQFHWDRLGKKDQDSSCWVRVSSPWAGQNWGMISLPRIGQEVIVDFLEGDPDRPIITGRVYNGEQKPPYKLPDHATVSTIKSQSSIGGSVENANELRFEDERGAEYVWLQAEKDFHQLVKNNATLYVTGTQDSIIGGDLTERIRGDVKWKMDKDWVTEVHGSKSTKATGDIINVSDASISEQSTTNIAVKAGTEYAVDAATFLHMKAGVNLVVEAGLSITLKASGSSVVIGPAGVAITGTMVMINSGGAPESGSGSNPQSALPAKDPAEKEDPLA